MNYDNPSLLDLYVTQHFLWTATTSQYIILHKYIQLVHKTEIHVQLDILRIYTRK